MRVAVLGAGFVGVTLADALVRRGCSVTLIDPAREIAGASATTFAWLNSHRKRPEAYQALNRRGLEAWRERFGPEHAEHVRWSGHSVVVSRPEHTSALRERVAHLRSLSYPAALVPLADAAAQVPGAAAPGAIAAEFPLEGHCAPAPIRASILASLEASARCTIVAERVVAIDGDEVTLRSGRRIRSDRVVIAAGNGSAALAASAGFELPMVPQEVGGAAWGYLARIAVTAHGIDRVLSTDDVNLRPDGPDALIAQCLDLDRTAGPDERPTPALSETFSRRMRHLLQREDIEVDWVRVGHRVVPVDGQTVAGPLDGSAAGRVWAVVTHSGITLAPLLAETIAAELVQGRQSTLLDGFRPARFAGSTAPTSVARSPRRPGEQ